MYIPTIGLEIHAELKTKTKMFCFCPNDPNERHPNTNVCPVCLGHPGILPTINREAVLKVIKFGLTLGGKIAEDSHFDRKSYFYPDLPKGYQISQYEKPLVEGGILKGIRIRRVHLEEDAGRLLHEIPGVAAKNLASFVDFNRAGTPLMELVTEPDIKDAREAVEFARELQLILRYLDISDADMEKGQLRVEANISIKPDTASEWGIKVEVKNLNSFRAVEGAIQYELKRQEELLKEGKKIHQETRGWDDKKGETISQRSKEFAHDYRYFPEPDLPPLDLSAQAGLREFDLESLKKEIPELPQAKRERFMQEFGFDEEQVEILVSDKAAADYFEAAASEFKAQLPSADFDLLFNYFATDLKGLMKEKGLIIKELRIDPEHFAHLIFLIKSGTLSSRLAKDLIIKMSETGEDPETLMKEGGIKIMGDIAELETIAKEIIEKNPKAVSDYKKGKESALQFLVGQAMAHTKGQASPEKLKELFIREFH